MNKLTRFVSRPVTRTRCAKCELLRGSQTRECPAPAAFHAARDSTIEGADQRLAQIDAAVARAVPNVVPRASIAFSRRAYADFSDVSRPEDFTDTDGNGLCDKSEPFEDANRNGTWDNDRGASGRGGARDAVLYSVTVTYARGFPMASLIGLPDTVTTAAATVLRNQPYKLQDNKPAVGACT